jgi:hypothetical protein
MPFCLLFFTFKFFHTTILRRGPRWYNFFLSYFKISFFFFRPCCVESLCFILPEQDHLCLKIQFLSIKKLKQNLWSFVETQTSPPSHPNPKYNASNYTQSAQWWLRKRAFLYCHSCLVSLHPTGTDNRMNLAYELIRIRLFNYRSLFPDPGPSHNSSVPIRIRIRIHIFLGLRNPEPLVRGVDLDPLWT